MIPFLYFGLKAVIRNLLNIVIEPVVIEACRSGKQFKEIDLSKKGNLLPLSKINFDFAVEKERNTLAKSGVVTIQLINRFRESARNFVVEMLYKLFERSSLGSTLLRCASVFDPICLLRMTQEKLKSNGKVFSNAFLIFCQLRNVIKLYLISNLLLAISKVSVKLNFKVLHAKYD